MSAGVAVLYGMMLSVIVWQIMRQIDKAIERRRLALVHWYYPDLGTAGFPCGVLNGPSIRFPRRDQTFTVTAAFCQTTCPICRSMLVRLYKTSFNHTN